MAAQEVWQWEQTLELIFGTRIQPRHGCNVTPHMNMHSGCDKHCMPCTYFCTYLANCEETIMIVVPAEEGSGEGALLPSRVILIREVTNSFLHKDDTGTGQAPEEVQSVRFN